MLRNIIFDYNGVISDDFEIVFKTVNRVLNHYGAEKVTFSYFKKNFQLPPNNFYACLLPEVNFNDINRQYFLAYKKNELPKKYSGIDYVLYKLYEKGHRLYIISAHSKTRLIYELKNFGIDPSLFNKIYGNTFEKGDFIRKVLDQEDYLPFETVFIGDSLSDYNAAKENKVRFIASSYGYTNKELFLPIPEVSIVDKAIDILRAIC